MGHQPYESWILSDQPLDTQQRRELGLHLSHCEHCSELSNAIDKAVAVLSNASVPEPSPGFTNRWKVRFSTYRQQKLQQKMWFLTLGLFSAAGLILMTLLALNITNINWFHILGQFIFTISRFTVRIKQFWSMTITLIRSFPILLPVFAASGSISIGIIILLFLTWVRSMIKLNKITIKRGTIK